MIYIKNTNGEIAELGTGVEIVDVVIGSDAGKFKIITLSQGEVFHFIALTKSESQAHAVIDWLWQQISAYGQQFVDINDCPALHD